MAHCDDCRQLTAGVGLQGPPGPAGSAGVAGNNGAPGAAGADGANILEAPSVDVGTAAAASPQNLRTFIVTPAMLSGNEDVIEVEGYLSSFISLAGTSITITFGGVTLFSFTGVVGSPVIAQEYYFKVSITRKSAGSQFFEGQGGTGVLNLMDWRHKQTTGAGVVDLSVNQNLILTVATLAGVFALDDIISRNWRITQLLKA